MIRSVDRLGRRTAGLVGLAMAVALLAAPAAWAQSPTQATDIQSAGPLSNIWIGNDLSCQVQHAGESTTEFYPGTAGAGDCGTLLQIFTDDADQNLYGPAFNEHSAGSKATQYLTSELSFTPVSQSLTGSGTAASPYQVITVVTVADPGEVTTDLSLTEADSYVVGNDYYSTSITIADQSGEPINGELYRAGDCFLAGSDNGFGALDMANPNAPSAACTLTANNSPSSALEEFVPETNGDLYIEGAPRILWDDINNTNTGSEVPFPNTCNCTNGVDNGEGLEWSVSLSAPPSQETFSFRTEINYPAISAGGGATFTGTAPATVSGTVATFTDPQTADTAGQFAATINWGDGVSTLGTITGGDGGFTVAGSHTYSAGGSFLVRVTIQQVGNSFNSSTVTDSATIVAPPTPVATGPPTVGAAGAGFTGSVNPSGLPTTAYFQYGLDPKYSGAGPLAYSQSTPAQSVGSDFSTHTVSASVSGLVPNALYHVRLVATNSAGTTIGPDVTFTTAKAPPPSPPTLGKTFNVSVVSGIVLVELHGQLVPITELEQIPAGTLIDALHGTIKLTTAVTGGSPARDAAAKGKKKKPVKTQTGTFGGAIFKITQVSRGANKGLANLTLVENAFKGAPTYGVCTAHKAADASVASLSSRTLQLLHASAHGKFRTTGRYSAATVRGTKWTVADRCDGTLTHDITDSVVVTDFVHHKTIILHAGQSYLAKKPK